MKKIIVASAMVLGLFTASAQTKIGYINTEELLASMPEATTVSNELEEYGKSLDMQKDDMIKDLNEKGEKFNQDSAKLSASMKEIKRKELQELYIKIQDWQQTAQEDMNRKSQEKLMPLRKKAMDAINAVAAENKYTYVLDINTIVVGPPSDNILPLVKKKLGIKDPAPAAKPAGTK